MYNQVGQREPPPTHDIANLLVTLHKITVIVEDHRYPATNQGVKRALAYSILITDHSLW